MAKIPFLNTLRGSALSAYPGIVRGVRQGLSSRQITETLRTAGINVSRTRTVLPLMREVLRVERQGKAVRYVAKNKPIDVTKLPTAITSLRRDFSYTVRVRGFAEGVGQVERYITVSTDNPMMTPGEIERAAQEILGDQLNEYGLEVNQLTVVGGQRR